jgi:hypothetical protein
MLRTHFSKPRGFALTEPDVALTDFALTVECVVFALALRSGKGSVGPLRRGFGALFLALAAGSALGGIWHGFLNSYDSALSRIVWSATLLSLGSAGLIVWFLVAEFPLYRPWRALIRIFGLVVFAAYALAVVFVTQAFQLAVLNLFPALVLLLAGYVVEYRRCGEGPLLFGIFGILLIFVATLLQQLGLDIYPVYFTHNAVYHVLQGVAFLLLFNSIDGFNERFKTRADSS